jgi:hypothetical protein
VLGYCTSCRARLSHLLLLLLPSAGFAVKRVYDSGNYVILTGFGNLSLLTGIRDACIVSLHDLILQVETLNWGILNWISKSVWLAWTNIQEAIVIPQNVVIVGNSITLESRLKFVWCEIHELFKFVYFDCIIS